MKKKRKRKKDSHVGSSGGDVNVEEGDGELSEGYETEELYSAEFEFNEEDIHKFVRYKKKDLNWDFQFKIGMNFCSLQELKEDKKTISKTRSRGRTHC